MLEGMPVKLPAIEVYPTAAGGGSIARPVNKHKITVGPDSAGAMPGPACYGLGGTEATSTDACVVLGYIDPDYFLGGKRKLDAGLAREVITDNLSRPLGISVEACGLLVTEAMEDICAGDIGDLIKARNLNPRDFVLFSFGGAGSLYCCGIADKVGIPRIYVFRFSSVFSTFGSSCADVLHAYESLVNITLQRRGGNPQIEHFNKIVHGLTDSVLMDMRGEGFPPEKVSFSLELEATAKNVTGALESPVTLLKGIPDIGRILDAFSGQHNLGRVDELSIRLFRLRATSPAAHPVLATHAFAGKSPEKALKGKREVYWKDGPRQTAVYRQPELACGNVVIGPAVIESDDTVVLIPLGKKYTVDNLLNGVIESIR